MVTKHRRSVAPDPYMALIRAFPLRPIHSEAELDAAIAVIDALSDRALEPGEQDYLDVLATLVEAYEDAHDPLPALSGVEALRFLIAQNGLSQAGLARETGLPETTLSEILSGKRGISPRVRTALGLRFAVAPSLFA